MGETKVQKPITGFVNNLKSTVTVDKVVVFGSNASGFNKENSDIDVVVVSDDFRKFSEDERLDLLYKCSRFIKPEIHPWGVTSTELEQASELTTLGYARDYGRVLK